MRNRITAIAALAALALLTGCTTGEPDAVQPSTSTSPSSTTATPSPDPQAGGRDDLLEPPTSSAPAPTWDDSAEQSALQTATDFLTAYLNTGQPPADWLAGISEFVAPNELPAFSSIDPMNIPYAAITGDPERLVDDVDSPYLAIVVIPVDDTTLRVTLARTDGASPWLVADLAQD